MFNGLNPFQETPLQRFKHPDTIRLERINPKKTVRSHDNAMIYFKKRALAGSRGTSQGWEIKVTKHQPSNVENGWRFRYDLSFVKTRGRTDKHTVADQFTTIVEFLTKAATGTKWQGNPWRLSFNPEADDEAEPQDHPDGKPEIKAGKGKHDVKHVETKEFYKLKPSWDGVFDRIYDLPHQIELLTASIDTAVDTNYNVRGHCLLLGPPSCGKTTVAETAVQSLGEEDVAYFRLDATSTTKAGIEKKLLESAFIPPIMVIEELEKFESTGILKFLLGLLDDRAEINKMNARIGHQRREVRLLCIATVNDLQRLKESQAGALASRFPNQINFPVPSEKTISRILKREIREKYPNNGNEEWAEKAVSYVCGDENCFDVRRAISVCLVGRDKLLDGSYQEALAATRPEEWIQ